MAQSAEALLVKQVERALNQMDFNIHQFAQGTTAYNPQVKARLAETLTAVAGMNAIDYQYGNYKPDDYETMRFFANLYQYVTGYALDRKSLETLDRDLGF